MNLFTNARVFQTFICLNECKPILKIIAQCCYVRVVNIFLNSITQRVWRFA